MVKKRTSQLLAELKKLTDSAVDNLYRRIEIAATVMEDLDWIAQVHGGSDLKAADALKKDFFPDLDGFITLPKLIEMYKKIEREEWEACHYNVRAVEVIYEDRHWAKKEKGQRTAWKKLAEERGMRIAELEKRITELEEQIKQLLESNSQLRKENTELRAQVAHKEGRIEEMSGRYASAGR